MTVPYRPMAARRPDEPHRASTPLELLFDLSFVVAVASAAAMLHHSLTEDHIGHGLLGYATVFFAIWWAWLNFTWFASSYDTDDVVYRVTTLVQITGVLVLAAGVPRAFEDGDFTVVTIGYVVMRLAMVSQWLRARHGDPERRPTATRYALGITVVQLGWIGRLFLPDGLLLTAFVVLAVCEMLVPVIAERAAGTTFHVGHVVERYGLFTLIVLGESILAASNAIRAGLDAGTDVPALVSLAFAGLVIVFALWWLYFDCPEQDLTASLRKSLTWGYGHYLVFASAAAVGAGLEVSVDYDTHATHLPSLAAAMTTTAPVAVYLLVVWFLQVFETSDGLARWTFPITAVLVLAASFGPAPIHVTAVLLAALVAVNVVSNRRHRDGA